MTVRFASGGQARIAIPVDGWIDRHAQEQPTVPTSAAEQIDGVGGREVIVTVSDTAASYTGFVVVAARSGKLVLLPAPARGWVVGGSVGTGASTFRCSGRHVITVDAVPTKHHGRYRLTETTYLWRSSGWVRVRQAVEYGREPGGTWECRGLTGWFG